MPVEGGLLYVEPVYVRGAGTNYPRMRKVLVAYNERIAFEDSLEQALNKVFGTEGRQQDGERTGPGDQEKDKGKDKEKNPPNASVADALKDAQTAWDKSEKAREKGDWEEYGKQQKALADALDEAAEAEKKGSDGSGSGSSG